MRIAVYGGTFDPPHNAHLAIARAALDKGVAERALFVLSADPPHKSIEAVTPFATRLEMLKLALAGEARFSISTMEEERLPKRSYTIDTMDELKAAHPENSYLLLIGSDSLAALHSWMRAGELVARHEIAVYPRKDEVPTLAELELHWPRATAEKLLASIIPGMPQSDLSSTRIRSGLANSENAGRFIPAEVLEFIQARKLYAKH